VTKKSPSQQPGVKPQAASLTVEEAVKNMSQEEFNLFMKAALELRSEKK